MRIPLIRGLIERRVLVNYRVDPDVAQALVPPPFEPLLFRGYAVAGICLIRLAQIRPRFWPAFLGIRSENAAHRIAVRWRDDQPPGDGWREGVYIPRRDTNSWLNHLVGGRLFPGVHHHARFDVRETADRFEIDMRSDDGQAQVAVAASVTSRLPPASIFGDLASASEFFARGSLGYSATRQDGEYDGLELRTSSWSVMPLDVERVSTSFFDDTSRFPAGAATFDCALLMRGLQHEWQSRESICCRQSADTLFASATSA